MLLCVLDLTLRGKFYLSLCWTVVPRQSQDETAPSPALSSSCPQALDQILCSLCSVKRLILGEFFSCAEIEPRTFAPVRQVLYHWPTRPSPYKKDFDSHLTYTHGTLMKF
jgi:hypothetical protein